VEVVYQRCAGLDIGKDEVVACIRVPDGAGGRHQEVHTFKTFSADREALADWLTEHGVTQAVMEATGQQLEAVLVGAGRARAGAAAGQRPPRQAPARPQDRRL
jgi:transposase